MKLFDTWPCQVLPLPLIDVDGAALDVAHKRAKGCAVVGDVEVNCLCACWKEVATRDGDAAPKRGGEAVAV